MYLYIYMKDIQPRYLNTVLVPIAAGHAKRHSYEPRRKYIQYTVYVYKQIQIESMWMRDFNG